MSDEYNSETQETLGFSKQNNAIRFFISFSSRDIPIVREIMAGIASQNINFWDYSDELQQINLTEEIKTRLMVEIDKCDYFVSIVSESSTSEKLGHFTRFEVDYALGKKKMHLAGRVIVIELEGVNKFHYTGPYEPLTDYLHHDFIWNQYKYQSILSYVKLVRSICQVIGIQYFPQISPHPRLPFWEEFRDEVIRFTHSNYSHVNLIGALGEFNEFFKNGEYVNALNAVNYFITSCKYLIPGYDLVFPWIVKAVTQQELNLHTQAALSYQEALKTDKNNPTALGGVGMAHLLTGSYNEAAGYFNDAYKNSTGIQQINERLNFIMAKASAGKRLDTDEKEFVRDLNIEETHQLEIEKMDIKELLPAKDDKSSTTISERKELIQKRYDEQRGFILFAKALSYFVDAEALRLKISAAEYNSIMVNAYNILKFEVPENKLNKADKIFYLYMSANYLGYNNPERILTDAIERSKNDKNLDTRKLYGYLAEHYTSISDYRRSIEIYDKWIVNNNPDKRELLHYAFNLKNNGNSKYIAICKDVLNQLPEIRKDYYWAGFANYLLGREEIAKYEYERSGSFDIYYDQY
jgi:hypothetical protein